MSSGSFCIKVFTSLSIGSEHSSRFSSNTRLRCRHPSLESSLLRRCRCERCKCCVVCCSQRRNVYTLREAEHVHAHTVGTTFAQLEHHNRNGSQDDLYSQVFSTGPLTTSRKPMSSSLSPTYVSGFLRLRVGFLVGFLHCRRVTGISNT